MGKGAIPRPIQDKTGVLRVGKKLCGSPILRLLWGRGASRFGRSALYGFYGFARRRAPDSSHFCIFITISMIYLICKRLFAFDMRTTVASNRARLNLVFPRQFTGTWPSCRFWKFGQLSIGIILATGSLASARDFDPWKPISPAEMTKAPPASAPDAPAEVLLWTISVDDSYYPANRKIREYLRYKIYDPEKSVNLTRISELTTSWEGEELGTVDFLAHLTLPDGTSKDFTKDSIQQRNIVQSGSDQNWFSRLVSGPGTEVQEKFLAVTGIEPGSILEIQFTRTLKYSSPLFKHVFQKSGIPVHHVEYTQHIPSPYDFAPRPFLINGALYHANLKADAKNRVLVVTADDLPPLYAEPLSPPLLDRSLAIAGSYQAVHTVFLARQTSSSVRIDPKDGPWASFASRVSMIETDATENWPILKRTAIAITAGATTDREKAERIHNYVHQRYLAFTRSSKVKRTLVCQYNSAAPEEVIEFEKNPEVVLNSMDFLWVAIGLYKAAGLKVQTILLPNNTVIAFDPSMTSEAFLPDACARVLVSGQWIFSLPSTVLPLPLGALPAANVGRVGLIAQVNKSEFVDVPAPRAEDSVISNSGAFELSPDGSMTGVCTRTLTGMPSYVFKMRLRNAADERRLRSTARLLKNELKAERVVVASVDGIDDASAPVVIHYKISFSDYATVTKSRLIFTPAIFESQSPPLFPDETRRNDVVFPFPFTTSDDFTVHMPVGYKLEAPSAPQSIPGSILSLTYNVTYVPSQNLIRTRRTHVSQLTKVELPTYPRLKNWFDSVAKIDSHELVLMRDPSIPLPTTAPSAPAAQEEDASPEKTSE
jgi:hypothetical protein